MPLCQFEGHVEIIETYDDLVKVIDEIKEEQVLGFDTETKPSFKKGQINQVALLQLSNSTKAWLLRLNKLGLPNEVVDLFEDNSLIKVGVGIRDDIRALNRFKPFKAGGFVEVQDVARDNGLKDFSLKKLAGIVLNVRVSKRQRLSNWESDDLSEGQVIYAATDAWIARKIFGVLKDKFPQYQVQYIQN